MSLAEIIKAFEPVLPFFKDHWVALVVLCLAFMGAFVWLASKQSQTNNGIKADHLKASHNANVSITQTVNKAEKT